MLKLTFSIQKKKKVIWKIQAEKLAGDVQADVLLVADAITFESLKEEDMLLSEYSI